MSALTRMKYEIERQKIIEFFTHGINQIGPDPDELTSITVPAPSAPLTTFLTTGPKAMSLLWDPYEGPHFAAWGVAYALELQGSQRFEQLRLEAKRIWRRVHSIAYPGVRAYVPRLFGGFAFEPGNRDVSWQEFGDGSFVLPRWVYRRDGATASLSLAISASDGTGPSLVEQVIQELEHILNTLETASDDSGFKEGAGRAATAPVSAGKIEQFAYDEWKSHIERIKHLIADGAFKKIVAARRARVRLDAPDDDAAILARLHASVACTRFCFRRRQSAFLGASPELLFAKSGRMLSTQALAGTARATKPAPTDESEGRHPLIASRKDREEHAHVVREIERALATIAREIAVVPTPIVWGVGDLVHLKTIVSATLRQKVGVVDALQALHPTPAVGGVPVREASRWIVENEPFDRGWYTGCVGWLDQDENGTFVVAIRCALITGGEALVFAGAGVVAESDPLKEYEETALKQVPILRALNLGVDPDVSSAELKR